MHVELNVSQKILCRCHKRLYKANNTDRVVFRKTQFLLLIEEAKNRKASRGLSQVKNSLSDSIFNTLLSSSWWWRLKRQKHYHNPTSLLLLTLDLSMAFSCYDLNWLLLITFQVDLTLSILACFSLSSFKQVGTEKWEG